MVREVSLDVKPATLKCEKSSLLEETLLDEESIVDMAVLESASSKNRNILFSILGRIVCRKRFLFTLSILVLIFGVIWLRQAGVLTPNAAFSLINKYQLIAPLIFVIVFAVMSILLLPTLPLNLAAGVLWGPLFGGVYSLIGVSIGASITFLLSRYVAREFVQTHFRHKAWIWLMDQVQVQGWKIVAFTRINPIFPTGPLNYFYGLTPISFGRYIITTILFLSPLTVIFAYVGDSVGNFMLNDEASNFMQNLMGISAGVVMLVIARQVIKRWFKGERIPKD